MEEEELVATELMIVSSEFGLVQMLQWTIWSEWGCWLSKLQPKFRWFTIQIVTEFYFISCSDHDQSLDDWRVWVVVFGVCVYLCCVDLLAFGLSSEPHEGIDHLVLERACELSKAQVRQWSGPVLLRDLVYSHAEVVHVVSMDWVTIVVHGCAFTSRGYKHPSR